MSHDMADEESAIITVTVLFSVLLQTSWPHFTWCMPFSFVYSPVRDGHIFLALL